MKIDLTDINLTSREKIEIEKLLAREDNTIQTDLEQIWYLMDLVWDTYGCDNKKLEWDKIGKFYSHPVWLLNGLFIEQHEESMAHRHAISDWVVKNNFSQIVDYGGGFGTLARLVAEKDVKVSIDIYEPHPSQFGLKRAEEFSNISIIGKLGKEYDCLLSTDVLEHVPDPLNDLSKMIDSVKTNGCLVIANCFFPVIKCHLPQTFHLRYTFDLFAKIMGLEVVGIVEGSHATIYKKVAEIEHDWSKIRFYEKISKAVYPSIDMSKNILRSIKRLIKR